MAYDKRDDDVFQLAEATNTLAEAMGERTLPRQMVIDETRRIAELAQNLSTENENLAPVAKVLGRIHSDFADERQDAEGTTLDLRDALATVRGQYASKITYEGVDASDQDEKMRRDYRLPGEKVSIAVRENGSKAIDPSLGLGDEPLTVSNLIIRGKLMDMGGEKPANVFVPEYEFEGREGRHPANSFHSENGQAHAFGVVLKRDDRVFLTPLTEYGDPDNPSYGPTGVSREIVGDAGRSTFHYVHPEGFKGLSEQLTPESDATRDPHSDKGPMVGEFSFDTDVRGAEAGPIRIAGIPWSGKPTDQQLQAAERQVDELIRSERHAALTSEIQAASDAYRKGRPDSGHGEPGFTAPREQAEVAAFNEARNLLRGREPSAALNSIVAEVATSNRLLREGGDLSGDRDLLQTALDMEFRPPEYPDRSNAPDHTMTGQIARLAENAPKGVSEVDNDMFTHVVGKGSISDPDTARRLDEIAAASTDSIRVAVADAPRIGVGTYRNARNEIEWSAVDANSGVIIRDGEQKDAASMLAAVHAVQKTIDAFERKGGIMSQAGSARPVDARRTVAQGSGALSDAAPKGFGEVRPHLRAAHLGGIAPEIHDRLARDLVAGRMSEARDTHATLQAIRAEAAILAAKAEAPRTETYPIVKSILDRSGSHHHAFEHTLKPVWEASKKLANDWSNGKIETAEIPERAETVARIAGEVLESSPAMKALREIGEATPGNATDLRTRSDAAAAEISSRLRLNAFLAKLEKETASLSLMQIKEPGDNDLLKHRAETISYSFIKEELPKYEALNAIDSKVSGIPVGLALRTMTTDEALASYSEVATMAGKALRDGPPDDAFRHIRRSRPALPTKGPEGVQAHMPSREKGTGR